MRPMPLSYWRLQEAVANLQSYAAMSPAQAKSNLAYITHAANILPELVSAVKHLQGNWEKTAARSVVVQPEVV
jgi:hypothetical protein